ncbi:MAG: purine-binding chemotaxis protein CheW [Desulfovibrionaceae bacterium]|nr:purine-binding chemotaxis protein CheW [Desulfovibrionaceae bacterium]
MSQVAANVEHTRNDAEEANLLQLVTFRLGEEVFGVKISVVNDIIRLVQITEVPNAPSFIKGVINLRGRVLPVVCLRKRFKMPEIPLDSQSRIIVMELHQNVVGFLVDAVSEVLRIPESSVEHAPPVVAGIGSEYIEGVGKLDDRLLILLDLEALLSHAEMEDAGR